MVKSKDVRVTTDQIAIVTKGRVTSQIRTQESSDKSKVTETNEDVPRTTETDEDVPRILSTKT